MDVVDNIRKGKYKTKLEYPNKVTLYQCKCGHNCSSFDKFCGQCGNIMGDMTNRLSIKTKEYADDVSKLNNKFEKDALKDVGLSKHEAKDRAFRIAWNIGHPSGIEDVYYVLGDIAYVILGE